MFFLLEIALFGGLLAIDLISKEIICNFLHTQSGESFVVIKDIFTFTYSENTGASFGAFSGNQLFLILLTSAISLIIVGVLVYKRHSSPRFFRTSLIIVLAGAVGNLVDRIAFNYVRDFLDYTFLTTWFDMSFAICNIADLFVFVGAVMLLFYMFFEFREVDFWEENKRKLSSKKSHL